jgi:hypothetical protein
MESSRRLPGGWAQQAPRASKVSSAGDRVRGGRGAPTTPAVGWVGGWWGGGEAPPPVLQACCRSPRKERCRTKAGTAQLPHSSSQPARDQTRRNGRVTASKHSYTRRHAHTQTNTATEPHAVPHIHPLPPTRIHHIAHSPARPIQTCSAYRESILLLVTEDFGRDVLWRA